MNHLKATVAKIRYFIAFSDKRVLAIVAVLVCAMLVCVGLGIATVFDRSILPPVISNHLPHVDNLPNDAGDKTITSSSGQQGSTSTGSTQNKTNSSTQTTTAPSTNTNSSSGTTTPTQTPTSPTPTPPTPPASGRSATYFGANPANPGGQSSSAAQTVITKWGSGSAIRQFFSSDLTKGPYHPSGASVVHSSYKPDVASVNSGALDDQIKALIQRTPAGDILEFYHEPDNDGLDATGIANMIAAKNRLYDLKQQVKPSVLVAATMTGGFFANYSTESERIPWYGLKGDLVGLDADGVYDTTGPTYDISYSDEIAGVKTFMTRNTTWKGWTVPEHGTARQPWDTTGSARASWFSTQTQLFIDNGAYAVMLFDYNTTGHDTTTNYNQIYANTPEFTVWQNLIADNP